MPAHVEIPPAWHAMRVQLRRAVGDSTFEIWLAPVDFADWTGSELVVSAPAGTRAWVENRFGRVIARAARMSFGEGATVSFVDLPDAHGRRAPTPTTTQPRTSAPASEPPALIPRFTFDQFIIGDGNRLAHAAALAVAENPGNAYNPLFLCAPPGFGKTHLLHAIGNYISAFEPSTTIRYTTVEAFTNGFVSAIHNRSLDRFKHVHRDVDVLLIDDVQFLASKAKTEEEFFHTFNALHDSGRQLVLTCDRLPRDIRGLEERLQARFEAGLVAHIAPPDHSTRLAILRKRAALDRVETIDPVVLELIADRIVDNVRALEGALIRVVAHHSLAGGSLDAAFAARVLDDILPPAPPSDTPTDPAVAVTRIKQLVAGHFNLAETAIDSSTRTAEVAWARQLSIFLARELTRLPLQRLGDAFGGRSHATMIHACRRVEERVVDSPDDRADLEALRAVLAAGADRGC